MAFRFAICNELFKGWELEQTCAALHSEGYAGIEIAPFTLAEDACKLSAQDRSDIRDLFESHRLDFVGLHWLLASPSGLHATSPDREVRDRTWAFLGGLIDLAADLNNTNEAPVLVFGSPKQRATKGGVTQAEATQMMAEGLSGLAARAQSRDVLVLLEPLSADQCDVVNSLGEAISIVEQIDSPAIQTMFDVHNAVDETLPHTELIRKYFPHIRHIHVNEFDGREPGTGNYDFEALLRTFADLDYRGWVSLEAFDFEREPQQIACGSLRYLTKLLSSRSLAHTL